MKYLYWLCLVYLSIQVQPCYPSSIFTQKHHKIYPSLRRLLLLSTLHSSRPGSHNNQSSDKSAMMQQLIHRQRSLVQRAWLSSTILPGLGQIYNKQYWKAPIPWICFGIAGYFIYQYNQQIHQLTASQNMTYHLQEYQRSRDLWLIFAIAAYLLHIADAYANAQITWTQYDDIDLSIPAPMANARCHNHLQ